MAPAPSAPVVTRSGLIAAVTAFLEGHEAHRQSGIRESLERAIDEAGPDALARLGERLATTGGDWTLYPSDPLARRIHHLLADIILHPDSTLLGIEHVAAVAGKPVVIVANHLSYSDANLFEILLHRCGGAALADRLTVTAGPKVYSSLQRRFSSLCFATIKVPQSTALSTGDAVMNTRDVARAARRSIDAALACLRRGEALLVFPEGTRSRTTGMQPLLPAVGRYFEDPGTWVLPVGMTGTETLFPIGEDALRPVRIVARVGRALQAGVLAERAGGDRRVMMDEVGRAVARLLPHQYRGAYGYSE